MKKFVSMLLVSAMLLTALTACDNKKPNDSDSNPSSSSTATVGDSTSTDGESSAGDSTSGDSSSTPEESSTPEDTSDPMSDEPFTDEISEPEGIDNSGLPFPENRAGEFAKAALATGNWPAMDIVDDQDFLAALFSADFNLESFEEFCFATNIISSQLNKVIVIKPKADNDAEVSAAVDAYLDAVKNDPNIAFYPMQQVSAEGAVKGKTDDGYYYIIVHKDGADIETEMLAAV